MLRHTFAVLSLKAGINIYDLKKLIGHASIVTTERYLHTNPEFLAKEIKKLDKLAERF